MGSFCKDFLVGKEAERELYKILEGLGREPKYAPKGNFPDWDIEDSQGVRWEVKNDVGSYRWGRMFFEAKCNGNPSGLYVTKADYWAHCIRDAWWLFRVEELRQFCEEHTCRLVADEETYPCEYRKGCGDGHRVEAYCMNYKCLAAHFTLGPASIVKIARQETYNI